MPAPDSIRQLIQRFNDHRASYLAGHYNETQLRRDFLDPFFAALGWDIFNQKNISERYREVIHEVSVEVEGGAKAADYAFRIGDKTIFFVEAKKPSVNIETNPEPAFQLRRYGWSKKLPISLLTDFEQLAVYDCRPRPNQADKPTTARIKLYHYSEYIEKWDEIAAIFSHEAVLAGAFDRFAEGTASRKGTAEVDDAFLAEIERWRDLLARNLALRNPSIENERELNFAVQMTIDRIIFLRICEDRGIEPDGQLHEIAKKSGIYPELLALFKRADTKYNSGLFNFTDDTLTPALEIDDKVFKDILHNLYYPESPYVFTYISTDILGQVYEQFLGKVIRLTAGHQAKVEEKPEVRKAGGVYYTPTYIVDYIVKNTVGKLLEDKTPREAARLRILDPACGSGSFLLGAYQYLLDWYATWYTTHEPEKWAKGNDPAVYQAGQGEWRLTTAQKKRILLDNIFGVDIDLQAVEVTRLSLLLKVLEGASGQLTLGLERLLPDLDKNIKCGNSLIGQDYFEGRMFPDEAERLRVNVFNWQAAFPHVFSAGGFDAIIGNPPYIRIQALQEWAPTEVEFYKNYKAGSKGNYDIYVVFVEKGLSLLNKNGRLGFILPHKFFNAQYGEPLRGIISSGRHLAKVVHFGDQQVFENATTYTCLMFLDKVGHDEFLFEKVGNLVNWRMNGESITGKIATTNVSKTEWNFTVGENSGLFEKLSQMSFHLADVADRIFQGLVTGADPVFILKISGPSGYFSESTQKEYCLEDDLMHPLCKGSVNIRRYHITELDKAILFPYKLVDGQAILLTEQELSTKYPIAWQYLRENRTKLEAREHGKWKHDKWYALGRTQNLNQMEQKKILTPSIAKIASYTLDIEDYFYFIGSGGGGGGGYGITLKTNESMAYEYILGLLNSKLLDTYLKSYSSPFSGGFFAYNRQYIEQLPIRPINFSDPAEKALHDRIVTLVERMLALHKQPPRTPQEKEFLQRDIQSTDQAIDALVYQLYALTPAEIEIVEGK